MSDGVVQVAPDSTGKKVDTSELAVGANSVERQRVVLADNTDAAGFAKVQGTAPAAADGGLTVREVGAGQGDSSAAVRGPMVQGVVSDTPEAFVDGELRPFSLTTDGRLRATVVAANTWMNLFDFGLGENPGSDPAQFTSGPTNPWGL